MKTYLITYDLINPNRDYQTLYEGIKSLGNWAHVLESVWIVKSDSDAVTIRDFLRKSIDGNDKLFVAQLNGEAAWVNLSNELTQWLKSNL